MYRMKKEVSKRRDSNMELLRIVTMLFILILHADFYFCGTPDKVGITLSPISAYLQYLVESVTIIGVNVFVLLSGWYGIKCSLRKILYIVFQTYFFIVLTYLFAPWLGYESHGFSEDFPKLFLINQTYPFIKQYLLLMILSPVLNYYARYAHPSEFRLLLYIFFIYQLAVSWIFCALTDFNGGNSSLSFIGLYLLARYIKMYSPTFSIKSAKHDALLYCMFTVFSATASYCFASKGIFLWDRFYMYNSPFVILPALFFLLFFSKLKVKYSANINFVAISCLAVYLFQCSPFMSIYGDNIGRWYREENTFRFVLYVSIMIFMVYFMAVLLDKGRLLIWDAVIYVYERMTRRVVA